MESDHFKLKVLKTVARIPKGRVMSYGQIAALCGSPRAAKIVGGIAHYGDQSLPWHRVVHKDGRLAAGYPGGVAAQKKHLEAEGVKTGHNFRVNMPKHLWPAGK